MRWIDAMCCNGRLCGEYAQRLGFLPERITYGHMTADVKTLAERAGQVTEQEIRQKRSELGLQGTVFLYVGQIIPRKGILQLLEAWKTFSRETGLGECSLLLVGGGPQEAECRAYCSENNLDNVRLLGVIDYDLLPMYYRCADVFVIPTLEDNWSLVVPEAMACGLPILCSKYNGCWPELVKPENGWVFGPLDVSDTVDALRVCLTKHQSLQAMGENSRRIVQNHTASQAADAIMGACSIALSSCRSRETGRRLTLGID
jgi:glycosyltransferase involved in cell wall biosynthesis